MDGHRVEASALVAADGANGTAGRALGLGGPRLHAVGLEGVVAYDAVLRERFAGRAAVELGVVPGGYGWIFPKADHLNVGVAGWASEGPRLRAHLRRLLAAHGLPEEGVRDLRGHRLPLRRPGFRAAAGRALLAGDAAGLVDPVSGEGIYGALLSAELAAAAVLDLLGGEAAGLEPYAAALERRLGRLDAASWAGRAAFDRFPRLAFALARAPFTWPLLERLLTGELQAPSEGRARERVSLAMLMALGGAAGEPAAAIE